MTLGLIEGKLNMLQKESVNCFSTGCIIIKHFQLCYAETCTKHCSIRSKKNRQVPCSGIHCFKIRSILISKYASTLHLRPFQKK